MVAGGTLSLAHAVPRGCLDYRHIGESWPLLPEGGALCLELRKMWLGKATAGRAEREMGSPHSAAGAEHRLMVET